jgi:serine/threonine protein kinase
MGLAHRDIKPDNIMLDSKFNLKLADFGFATEKEISYKMKGTVSYMAPELLANLPYKTKAVDLFAAIVLLFIMITQRCPFEKADPNDELYSFVILKDWEGFWEHHAKVTEAELHISDEFKDLISKMIVVNSNERLSLEKLKKHPWYKGEVPTRHEIFENFSYRKLMKEGQLSPNDVPLSTSTADNSESQQEKLKQILETKNCDILATIEKMSKLYTKYFNCSDGDKILKQVMAYAKDHKYSFKVCDEYYR